MIGNNINNNNESNKIIIGSSKDMIRIQGGVNWNIDKIENLTEYTFINEQNAPAQIYFFDNTLTSVTLPTYLSNISYRIIGQQIIFKRKYTQTPQEITFYTEKNIKNNFNEDENGDDNIYVNSTITYPSRIIKNNNIADTVNEPYEYRLNANTEIETFVLNKPYLTMDSSVHTITFICDGTDWYQI